jgi:uncharacterized protein YcbK (DUF882 family)
MVIIKPGVNITGLHPKMQMALDWAEECYEEKGHALIITSAYRDVNTNRMVGGSPFSKHLDGKAVDCRIWNIGVDTHRIYGKIKRGLEDHGFDVILESNHIHIEYDPKEEDEDKRVDELWKHWQKGRDGQ